jgi:hypothetical protein
MLLPSDDAFYLGLAATGTAVLSYVASDDLVEVLATVRAQGGEVRAFAGVRKDTLRITRRTIA